MSYDWVMQNRNRLLDHIDENLGAGKAHIVFTPKGVDSESFLLEGLKKRLEKEYKNSTFFYFTGEDALQKIAVLGTVLATKEKVFVLINDLSHSSDPLSIINSCYANNAIEVIATTSVSVKGLSGKNMTDIRGRYISYFYPPFLYGDERDANRKSVNKFFDLCFGDYKYKDIALEIYRYMLSRVGQLYSFREIYSSRKFEVSLVTFMTIANHLLYTGLVYMLTRVEISNLSEVDYRYAFYPSRAFDLLDEEVPLNKDERGTAYYDSLLVAKAFYDDQRIYRAIHLINQTADHKDNLGPLSRCFYIEDKNQRVLLKTDYCASDQRSMAIFQKFKGNIQKIIVSSGNRSFYMDDKGILKCGIQHLLREGVFSYGSL